MKRMLKALLSRLYIAQWKLKVPASGQLSLPRALRAPEHKTDPNWCVNGITSCGWLST